MVNICMLLISSSDFPLLVRVTSPFSFFLPLKLPRFSSVVDISNLGAFAFCTVVNLSKSGRRTAETTISFSGAILSPGRSPR